MAKRRTLKKNINYICSELFAECVALTHYKVDIKQEDVDNVMTRILLMHDEFVSRILQKAAHGFQCTGQRHCQHYQPALLNEPTFLQFPPVQADGMESRRDGSHGR